MKTQLLLVAGLMLGGITVSLAQSDDEQQACQDDAFNVCGAFIPDRDRVFNCMVENKDRLSPRCRALVAPYAPPDPSAVRPVKGKPKPKAKAPVKNKSNRPIDLNPK